MPQMMRAVSQSVLGGPEVLELVETERPEPYYDEVLVRVCAAGVNPVDPAARERGLYIGQPPFVLGWDVSGILEEVGTGGDAVPARGHGLRLPSVVSDVDVVLNTIPGDCAERSVSVIRDGGVLAELHLSNAGATFPEEVERGISTRFMLVEPDPGGMRALSRLIEDGELRVHVSRTFPLADAAAAHRAMEDGHVTGKIVLTVAEEERGQ